MRLYVAGYRYTVFAVANLTNPTSKEPIQAWTDFLKREIYLSLNLPLHCREEYLLHEYKEAWLWYFGKPEDKERDCDRFAAMYTQFRDCMDAAGDRVALLKLPEMSLVDGRIQEIYQQHEAG